MRAVRSGEVSPILLFFPKFMTRIDLEPRATELFKLENTVRKTMYKNRYVSKLTEHPNKYNSSLSVVRLRFDLSLQLATD